MKRLAASSCIFGIASLAGFGLATLLFQRYPAAAGHRSAFTSEAGVVLLLLSLLSFVLAPLAVATGGIALRRLPREAKAHRIAAWLGIATGLLYGAVLLVPIVAVALR